jgi:hypothetical protein
VATFLSFLRGKRHPIVKKLGLQRNALYRYWSWSVYGIFLLGLGFHSYNLTKVWICKVSILTLPRYEKISVWDMGFSILNHTKVWINKFTRYHMVGLLFF